MAKFTPRQKLPEKEQERLLLEFCQALVIVKDFEEAANLLTDLLSSQEIAMIAKRLKIAKLLIKGLTYEEIKEHLRVSEQTIARVNVWLQESGAGYRLVCERSKEEELVIPERIPFGFAEKYSWEWIKRKYPMYFWPQLLLEEIVKSANEKQRKRLLETLKILKKSKQKHRLFKQLEIALRGGETDFLIVKRSRK